MTDEDTVLQPFHAVGSALAEAALAGSGAGTELCTDITIAYRGGTARKAQLCSAPDAEQATDLS